MSELSEEEIIKTIKNMLEHSETQLLDYEALALQGLLDLYQKEKEKNEEIENKIKEKIKLINSLNEKIYYEENVMSILQELLEERN